MADSLARRHSFSVTHFDCEYPIGEAVDGSSVGVSYMTLLGGGRAKTEASEEQKYNRELGLAAPASKSNRCRVPSSPQGQLYRLRPAVRLTFDIVLKGDKTAGKVDWPRGLRTDVSHVVCNIKAMAAIDSHV